MDYRITDYGAVADGTTNNRAAIQAAVDACTVAGGGRVIVPIGQFLSGTIVLKSNVTLYLERGGAELISSLRNVVKICYFSMWNILEKIPELSEHLWEKNMEQIAEGWFLDLQEFLEVWPSVKGGGNTKRRWLYMYPVFWFDEPKSVEVWKRKKNAGSTVRTNCSFISVEGKLLCWSSPVDCAGRSSRGGSLSDDFSA